MSNTLANTAEKEVGKAADDVKQLADKDADSTDSNVR